MTHLIPLLAATSALLVAAIAALMTIPGFQRYVEPPPRPPSTKERLR